MKERKKGKQYILKINNQWPKYGGGGPGGHDPHWPPIWLFLIVHNKCDGERKIIAMPSSSPAPPPPTHTHTPTNRRALFTVDGPRVPTPAYDVKEDERRLRAEDGHGQPVV